jgi:hypothetical protein
MQQMLRLTIAAVVAVALTHFSGAAAAQMVNQIKLTEKHIEGFISAQKDMAAVSEKMQGTASDKPDPKIQAELEAIAKKHGFKDFADYDDVAANISMIMAGIDPQTKAFTEPAAAIKKEIEEVEADKSIPAKEKKQMLDELNAALKETQPIRHRGNIELVKKYFDRLELLMQ